MAELIAIGYPDTDTAGVALDEIERVARDFVIRPDQLAAIVRDENGNTRTFAYASISPGAPDWAMFWNMLFALLYYGPILGMPVGSDVAKIIETIERSGIDVEFLARARDMLVPGSSALFLIIERVRVDRVVQILDEFGGTVLQSPLTKKAQHTLQEVLHGRNAVAM
jgi:uncharacterized membrane protein